MSFRLNFKRVCRACKGKEGEIMNRRTKLSAALLILFCFAPLGRAVMKTDDSASSADELLKKISAYEEGQSRENIIKLEETIRRSHSEPRLAEQLQSRFLKFLRSDATADGKKFICRQLSVIGTEEAVPTLSEMLTQPEVSEMALYALERIPGEAADDALCKALDKTSGKIKIGIINSLGQRKSKTAVAPLGKLLSSSDEQIANSVAASLGKIADLSAADRLCDALERTTGSRRAVLADACLACAYNLAASGNKKAAARIYKKLYDPAESALIRSAALTGIVETAPQDAPECITGAIKSGEPALQAAAIRLIKKIPEATDSATEQMPNLSTDAQVQLLSALAESKDIAALPAITNAVKSEDQTVRAAALKALASAGDASTVPLLAQAAADSNGLEQQAARESLYLLNATGVNEKIIQQIPRANSKLKVELIKTLGERNMTDSLPTLLETARDSDVDVRIESLKVLKSLAGARHLKDLVDILTNAKSPDELTEAEKTVSAVARRADGSAPAMIVQDAFVTTDDPNICCALLRVLGDIGDRRSLGGLRVALREENDKIHTEAVRALSKWPDAAPADDLLKIAITPKNEICRVLALRGYVRMAGLDDGRDLKEKIGMFGHAMDLAAGPGEKKMILSALTKAPSPEALQMAVDCLDKEDLQQEAAVATIKIAEATAKDHPEKTKAALEKALTAADNDALKQQIQQLLNRIN